MTLAIVLLLLAMALVTLELMIPSFGLLSLMAAASYAFAIAEAFDYGATFGWTIVGVGILLLPIALALGLRLLPKTPIGRRLLLEGPQPENIQRGTLAPERASLLGRTGTALTDLRPAGTALFDSERLDVVSDGPFVPKGTQVTIVAVQGLRSVVRPVSSDSTLRDNPTS